MAKRKDPAAVKLGRRGGKARGKNMTPEQRSESARRAALARWGIGLLVFNSKVFFLRGTQPSDESIIEIALATDTRDQSHFLGRCREVGLEVFGIERFPAGATCEDLRWVVEVKETRSGLVVGGTLLQPVHRCIERHRKAGSLHVVSLVH